MEKKLIEYWQWLLQKKNKWYSMTANPELSNDYIQGMTRGFEIAKDKFDELFPQWMPDIDSSLDKYAGPDKDYRDKGYEQWKLEHSDEPYPHTC